MVAPVTSTSRPAGLLSAVLGASLLATGCTKMAADGEVVDVTGKPIEGALVTAIGSPCQARSDATGRFSFECVPGTYDLVVSAEGYTTARVDLEAAERKRYDLGKQLLVKIPDEKGLFLLQGGAYATMKPGLLVRKLEQEGPLTRRAMCLDTERSQPNMLAVGRHALFDYEHVGWRPFRLDAEGCAYRDTKNEKHQWTVEYREKADYMTEQVNPGKTVALMELQPGNYFIADWANGFFTPADEKSDKHSFTGYWLQVQ